VPEIIHVNVHLRIYSKGHNS